MAFLPEIRLMSFSAKYFTGTVTGGDSQHNYTTGTYTATITADASDTLSGTWTYSGSYVAESSTGSNPYILNGSGSISFSGTLTGSLLSGFSNSWKVYFNSSDSRFVPGTSGFLDRSGSTYDLDAVVSFDLRFQNYVGQTVTERFGGFNHNLYASALPPIISIDHYTGSIPEDGVQVSVTLSRSGADLGAASTVELSTEDGVARSTGTSPDFIAINRQVVTFAAGVTSVTVPLNIIIDDTNPETSETFGLVLSNPVNASLGFSTGSVSIIDNELVGNNGAETITGGASRDTLIGNGGNDTLNGGAGTDTAVYSGNRSSYTISRTATGYTVTSQSGTDGTDTLTGVERLKFADSTLALDIAKWDLAGEVYRLYQAAFHRTPDIGGLTYWVGQNGSSQTHEQIAHNFIVSNEFKALYGTNPTNGQLITAFYANVLNRAPDPGGYDYWLGLLNNHQITPEQLLINFSESDENVALVGTAIQNGIVLN
jgi:hypothetical protein